MMAASAEKILFVWEGTDREGRRAKGEIAANSEAQVRAEVRRRGFVPVKVKKKPKDLFAKGGGEVLPKDIAIFARQMATMMSAGMPLVQAIELVGRSVENKAMSDLIMKVKADIESGTNFADALAKHPVHFDDLFVSLVRAGEQAGALETILDRLAIFKEKIESIKAKIKKAMTYPIAVMVVAFVVTAILLIFVVPQFRDVFQGFGADLPAFTLFVINLSDIFKNNWYFIFGGIAAVVFTFTYVKKRSRAFQQLLDRLILRMPIFGALTEKSAIARFSRTLSTMFAAGMPLVEALQSVAGVTGNIVYSKAVMDMKVQAETGQQLQFAMGQSGLFPPMVVQMVAIGEESGNLDEMLAKVADYYEEEVDNLVDAMSSLMEPMIMAFLGIVVGGLVIAMYLPIFKLGAVV